MGHPLSYNRLAPKLQQMWKTNAHFSTIDLGYSCFIIKCTLDDYFSVIASVPWLMYNHYLMVHRWKLDF
ncbi:hypothetical protein REPUB_Repub13aG0009900 [Reevesia pubescens]